MKRAAFALIRIETDNYGWVVSRHRTRAAAEAAEERASVATHRRYSDALTSCMYRIASDITADIGERVRG